MKEEDILRFRELEAESNQLSQELELFERNINELLDLKESLKYLKEGREVLVNIGKRVFVPVRIVSDKFFVEVGDKKIVKKKAEEIEGLIDEQLRRLELGKDNVMRGIESVEKKLEKLLDRVETQSQK